MTSAAPTVHPSRAVCEVSMEAVRANVRSMRSRLQRGTELWAVVKANAYGHDVHRVAESVIAEGVRRLCVATLSEAMQLRRGGIRVPLLVMGPLDAASIDRAHEVDIDISVLSGSMVEAVLARAHQSPGRALRVHLKVDTGMGRWGIPLEQASAALDVLVDAPGIEVVGVMTHFATADDEQDDGFFDAQLARFSEYVASARCRVPSLMVHAANSAATIRSSEAHFDAVRCGVALYGLSPFQSDPRSVGLVPAMTVHSHVADIRQLAPGESVGYGRAFIADRPCSVALVPIGYADGIRRALSGTGEAIVGGVRVPYAGTVSMDHLSLVLPDGMHVDTGDVVTLIGADGDACITAEEHAVWSGTINYEITCGVADEPRLQRRYHEG
jgi:alanine racemase